MLPFLWMTAQIVAIFFDTLKPQFNNTPFQPFAHLTTYTAKSGPTHIERRQGPLQKVDTLGIGQSRFAETHVAIIFVNDYDECIGK
jgi:hypothetical protein